MLYFSTLYTTSRRKRKFWCKDLYAVYKQVAIYKSEYSELRVDYNYTYTCRWPLHQKVYRQYCLYMKMRLVITKVRHQNVIALHGTNTL